MLTSADTFVMKIVILACAVALFVPILLNRNEGIYRSMQFWWGVFPVYLHYRFIQLLKRDLRFISHELGEQLYEKAHSLYALRLRDLHYSLRGYYLKNAQLLSVQPDLVPRAYMEWMQLTQDSVPSEFSSPEAARFYCRQRLQAEAGLDFDQIFSDWQDTPLGIASIGQVHQATLRSTGAIVAVKLQFPGMEKRFRSDLRTLKAFCSFAMPQHVTGFEEVEKNFDAEFNYLQEAHNLELVREGILPRWGRHVHIPRPYLEISSRSVLVMEFIQGKKLLEALTQHFTAVARLMDKSLEELQTLREGLMKNGSFPYRSLAEERQFYRKIRLGSLVQPWKRGPGAFLDIASILETLSEVHATELFFNGVFNADCHPGNVLLMEDGRLGLLDYGQVKHLDIGYRVKYAKLILAIARDDREEIVRLHFDEIGVRTKYRNASNAYLAALFYHDRDSEDVCGKRDIVGFLDYMESVDPMLGLPEPYLLAMRGNMILRGVGKVLGVRLHMSQLWAKEACSFLKSHNAVVVHPQRGSFC